METYQAPTSSTGEQIRTLEGIQNTHQYLNCDYLCSLCCEIFDNPHLTKCGHTFCYKCISVHLRTSELCPQCSAFMKIGDMIENVLMKKLIIKYRIKDRSISNCVFRGVPPNFIRNVNAPLSLANIFTKAQTLSQVQCALRMLKERKQSIETNQYIRVSALMHHFIKYFIREHEMKLTPLNNLIQTLRSDHEQTNCDSTDSQTEMFQPKPGVKDMCMAHYDTMITDETRKLFEVKRKFFVRNFHNFRQCYFDTRVNAMNFGVDRTSATPLCDTPFYRDFEKCLRYQSLKLLATVNYSPDIFNTSNIVSGVEFDKDEEFLAVAGVIQEVKIYHYETIINDVVDIHYPTTHWTSVSKISSLAWNPYHKNMLAWSDYDGAVAFWDVTMEKPPKMYYEHEKRCWSIDFNKVNPKLLASGSDDGKLKIWSINDNKSVNTIQGNSNICCVKFNPNSSHKIAFGSADHNIYYYDLRQPNEPLGVMKGHRKTVSYVKFTDEGTMVSASTDSQLKLWDVEKLKCVRTFTGHRNNKNFVGLATDGDYIACGAETNSLHIYYKNMERPVFEHLFRNEGGILNERPFGEQYSHEFISAVSWRKRSNCIVAANSQGIVNIIEMCDERLDC